MLPTALRDLELNLDVFLGPFDLLLSLILKEELDIVEIDLAEIVIGYLDHLDRQNELDLDAATEFLVLIAVLLELKSRLLLPGEELEEIEQLVPERAAEELLERMLRYARFRSAGEWIGEQHDRGQSLLFRSVSLPGRLRTTSIEFTDGELDSDILGKALGTLLRVPPAIDTRHISVIRVSLPERIARLRSFLTRGRFSFDDALETDDRIAVAVTLYALLELYKGGEAAWVQEQPFGPIMVERLDRNNSETVTA